MATPYPNKYTSKLANARILILGGTSGIGFCVAEACLEAQSTVILSGSKPAKIDTALTRLRDTYPDNRDRISGQVCDLSDPATLEANITALFSAVTSQPSSDEKLKLDHIVITAGNAHNIQRLSAYSAESIQAAGTVRFVAPILVAKHAARYLSPGPGSSITLTGGSSGAKPTPGWVAQAAYAAGKEGMVRALAVEMAPVRVNCVSPGAVRTELFNGIGEEVLKGLGQASLTGTVGRPEDVAEAYLYAMRDSFVTGSVIASDGGRLLK